MIHAPLMHVAWLYEAIQLKQHIRTAASIAALGTAHGSSTKQQCSNKSRAKELASADNWSAASGTALESDWFC
jgi:hypothetical protein